MQRNSRKLSLQSEVWHKCVTHMHHCKWSWKDLKEKLCIMGNTFNPSRAVVLEGELKATFSRKCVVDLRRTSTSSENFIQKTCSVFKLWFPKFWEFCGERVMSHVFLYNSSHHFPLKELKIWSEWPESICFIKCISHLSKPNWEQQLSLM